MSKGSKGWKEYFEWTFDSDDKMSLVEEFPNGKSLRLMREDPNFPEDKDYDIPLEEKVIKELHLALGAFLNRRNSNFRDADLDSLYTRGSK